MLVQEGPATVGSLARRVGGDPGQISFHLRELAKRGWIELAPELARDRRETWWRAESGSTQWTVEDFATPEGRAVATHLYAQTVTEQFERLRQFIETREQYSPEWQRTATSSQSFLYLTPEETHQLMHELDEVLRRWAAIGDRARETGDTEGRTSVFHFMHGFPDRPGESAPR
jgi:DNA-binding transcriptional ArsR family regulator